MFGFSLSDTRETIESHLNCRKTMLAGFLKSGNMSRRCRSMTTAELNQIDTALNYAFANDSYRQRYDKKLMTQFSGKADWVERFASVKVATERSEVRIRPKAKINSLGKTFDPSDTSAEAADLFESALVASVSNTKAFGVSFSCEELRSAKKEEWWVFVLIWGRDGGFSHTYVPAIVPPDTDTISCVVNLSTAFRFSKGINISAKLINRSKGFTLSIVSNDLFLSEGTFAPNKAVPVKKSGAPASASMHSSINEALLRSCLDDLNAKRGLYSVKEEMAKFVKFARNQIKERELGYPTAPIQYHRAFLGNPGTGKTTVANLYGQILRALGLVKTGETKEVSVTDLVGQFIGETSIKTRALCESAYGGILFIDEAYQLYHESHGSNSNSHNDEAITELLLQMENHSDELVVVLAGYTKPMENLLNKANPGLKSRIGKVLLFDDYDASDLVAICKKNLQQKELYFEPASEYALHKLFEAKCKLADETFGNAREARTVADAIYLNRSYRVGQSETLMKDRTIHVEDISNIAS